MADCISPPLPPLHTHIPTHTHTHPHPPTAQQEAQRAQFIVERAKQERQEKVVRAEGEAEAARMISTQPPCNVVLLVDLGGAV